MSISESCVSSGISPSAGSEDPRMLAIAPDYLKQLGCRTVLALSDTDPLGFSRRPVIGTSGLELSIQTAYRPTIDRPDSSRTWLSATNRFLLSVLLRVIVPAAAVVALLYFCMSAKSVRYHVRNCSRVRPHCSDGRRLPPMAAKAHQPLLAL